MLVRTKNKYSYSNLENEAEIYIFDINFKTKDQKHINIRKIKKSKFGNLISTKDKIDYNQIDFIKVEVLDLNNPSKKIEINGKINNNKKNNLFSNNKLKINFEKVLINKTLCQYFLNIIN